jgi:hypothetical protein
VERRIRRSGGGAPAAGGAPVFNGAARERGGEEGGAV